jgi:hypothetical protein
MVAAMPVGSMAIARNSHSADFFNTPDTKASGAPEFAGRPLSESWANGLQNNDGDMPRIDLISAVPSISGDQRKQLNDLYQITRKQMQPYFDENTALQKRLKEIRAENAATAAAQSPAPSHATAATKGAPLIVAAVPQATDKSALSVVAPAPPAKAKAESWAPAKPGPAETKPSPAENKAAVSPQPAVDLSYIDSLRTEEQVNAKITEVKKKIRDNADLLRDKMFALLTDEQKDEMIAMRHGTLIIKSDARTDVPQPPQPATPAPPAPKAPPPAKAVGPAAGIPSAAGATAPKASATPTAGSNQAPAQAKDKETTEPSLMSR